MPRPPTVDLRIYPDDCDAYGHVNQAAFLRLLERARWETLAHGPGMDVFTRAGAWPAIRRNTVEYHAPAFPGDVLSFDMSLTHLGRTSFSMQQVARRQGDRALVASAQVMAICIDAQGRPVPVPDALREYLGVRPAIPCDQCNQYLVRGSLVTVDRQGDGDAILLIHGFPFDRTMWRAQVMGLPGYHRIAPDLRGFGMSDPPGESASLATHADDLVALLDQLKVGKFVVCGLSMGGYVALDLWRRYPDRIRAMVLVDTRAEPDSADGRHQRDRLIGAVGDRGTGALVEAMTSKLLARETFERQPLSVGHVKTMILEASVPGAVSALAAMRDRPDSTGLLPGITVPALVIAGAEDAIIPASAQEEMARKIPRGRYHSIAGAGHMPPLEQPEEFNRLLAAFLRSLP